MYNLFRKIMFQRDPETAHNVTLFALAKFPSITGWFTESFTPSPTLSQTIWGIPFTHPIGLAAGLDKDAQAVDGLFRCGFSFLEIGTVTPRAQPGNPKPRMFRLIEDNALINRMGFNNQGANNMAESLIKVKRSGPIGINIGKNKMTPNEEALKDYLSCFTTLFQFANYIVINVSSPNTPGLRNLQSESAIRPLVQSILSKRDELMIRRNGETHHLPILIKLAPDLADDAVDNLGRTLTADGIDGFIASNTTTERSELRSCHQRETGGLSGQPLQRRSTEIIRILSQATKGSIPIIGSGGVFSAIDAYDKILAGASLVQIYTGFIYRGPRLIKEIVEGVAALLKQDGFHSIQDAIGTACDKPLAR